MITIRDIPHCEEILNTNQNSSYWTYQCRLTDRYGNRYEVEHASPRVARKAVHKKVVLVELQRRFWDTKALSAEEAHCLQVVRKFVHRNRYLLAL